MAAHNLTSPAESKPRIKSVCGIGTGLASVLWRRVSDPRFRWQHNTKPFVGSLRRQFSGLKTCHPTS